MPEAQFPGRTLLGSSLNKPEAEVFPYVGTSELYQRGVGKGVIRRMLEKGELKSAFKDPLKPWAIPRAAIPEQ